jgi:hypothetical protein
MKTGHQPVPWRAITRGVLVVYGVTFLSALLFALNGITPQTDRVAYPLLAFLTGAIGVAVALRVANTTHFTDVAILGVGIWLLNVTSVLIGAQSFAGWLESSLFVCATLILGRLLIGAGLERSPSTGFVHTRTILKPTSTMQTPRVRGLNINLPLPR